MKNDDLTDDQICSIVEDVDTELFHAGVGIKRRLWKVPDTIMDRLGYAAYDVTGSGKPEILERVERAYRLIYRPQDLADSGHVGMFMYRDIFAQIRIPPFIFGIASLRPLDFVDLSAAQIRMLQAEPEELQRYHDQFCDIFDIQFGTFELKACFAKKELINRFIGFARLHLQAASAILTGGCEYGGAIQSAILATELALKSGAASLGLSENEIRNKFGHNLLDLLDFVSKGWPSFDSSRVSRVISKQPEYVSNRYYAEQPTRINVGHIVMGTQYVVSEIVRQLSNRNSRITTEPEISRYYPA